MYDWRKKLKSLALRRLFPQHTGRRSEVTIISGDLMETFTWAGAVAAVTERIGIISTVHVTVNHPVFVAKAEATVDLISNGRAGMNLVLGWYPPDMQLFGYEVKEHSDRFELADEWIHIFDRLWSERKSFDYKGKNYELKAAFSQPQVFKRARCCSTLVARRAAGSSR